MTRRSKITEEGGRSPRLTVSASDTEKSLLKEKAKAYDISVSALLVMSALYPEKLLTILQKKIDNSASAKV
jgi:hypothetical protein